VSITVVAAVDRDTRVADLAIHGWRPVYNSGSLRRGIYNDMLKVGFSVRIHCPLDPAVKVIGVTHAWDSYEDCAWDTVTDAHLDAIEERLAQT
jgi:hypothetical protein